MGNLTFAIIKPDAVKNNYTGLIYDRILKAGFNILSAKLTRMSLAQAEGFYSVHKGKPFYNELTEFMSSGQAMVLALRKENAVAEWRKTIGATNPADADSGTIRKDFATSLGENAVHGSDSDDNAIKEIAFFFSDCELISNN
ncbi:MAG: nucleoside-diphosphate kinase [Candidatus Marinimicrobia bacterium]|jgi:nucleoside-diphosphate kinase|nr:nucleoside-diphosphate kinase [Candidatus Neomarinimicrobiota bacterium]MBT3633503.1 nucleoside-diphosphate kinase [Candidatus Neomarinimicrobiota bacterium]MBT3681645.1 nucleoside-diphosphate kinase [Candidatus Neomarinimicrobiota bacterium]MBT3758387.1 nucleoside-diphosphate kinase [Candidatus Neomarinimicrobiota bacterium]MBT3894959.1 nucleoside-diphosphate kinase [Candidatus Neomarinimicrobiota bacterium]